MQDLCRKYGTLLVLDEVQTGMYRTGRFLAAHSFNGQDPDMVMLAKALSGGLIPVGGGADDRRVYEAVYNSLRARDRPYFHLQRERPGHARRPGNARTSWKTETSANGPRSLGELIRSRLAEALCAIRDVRSPRAEWVCSAASNSGRPSS